MSGLIETFQTLLSEGSLMGVPAPYVMLALVGMTFISEDLACVSAGLLAAADQLPLALGIVACGLGIWIGDVGLYALGRAARGGLLSWPWVTRWASPERLVAGEKFVSEKGTHLLLASRFLPGARLPAFLAAGALRYPLGKFMLLLILAASVWTPIICVLSLWLGRSILPWLHDWRLWLALPLVWLIVALGVPVVMGLFTWRGRRLLLSRWVRLTHWEFWPGWVFYTPVAFWMVWLSIKHRSVTIFTLCNPGIRLSGLAMESKSAILAALAAQNPHASAIATWALLRSGETKGRVAVLKDFMSVQGLPYPIVLKPDVGERGQGVAIINDEADAHRYLAECQQEVIAQRHVSGLEFGVFYLRQPGAEQGQISSLAQKHPFSLFGDGVQTLEELILSHPRAVAMARYFLKKFALELANVPARGVEVKLTEIGTHCRGAIFTDARHLLTPELARAIEALTVPFLGFHYGRYDLRVPSLEDLKAGRNLQILELNGVTAEPVHVYDPAYPLWRAWHDVCVGWSAAFAAGAALRAQGYPVPGFREIRAALRAHRQHSWFEADDLLKPMPLVVFA